MDIDAACFMMLSQYFQMLLGALIRWDNNKVRVKYFEDSNSWLYVIFHSVVVKVFDDEAPVDWEIIKEKNLGSL